MKILVLASASVLAFATPALAQTVSNQSYVQQIGNENAATVLQNDDTNVSQIFQASSNDTALVEMSGGNNQSLVLQQKTDFVSGRNDSQTRMSGYNGTSITSQSGEGNYANVTFSPASGDSSSLIMQDGKGNEAIVASGDWGNASVITQTFDENYANVYQDGYNNVSVVVQDGLANTANVTQH
ncbi:hypothetical protein [Sphingomonas carotinifaciens]|uniref:Curlin associated repeat-containing protein n=1 Tax=Sphingomonas carotinifaciens TaxID=1166323 RepID=A0A1G7QVU2_9SPHN|nr:hypothetical protein [Sphingomonas carotinifaciens]MBB4087884.1 hypothetical protein [Sphingomonas carotinifaciens]MWC42372.1 hypothetical protein [Sphingomonas carotinifaciens]SDG02627.1 Curlin associated repeat-containing protein [Sphingomonas carotinifaciens]